MTVALIIGSNGFVGSHLRRLVRSAGWTVVGLGHSDVQAPAGEHYVMVDVTVQEDVVAVLESYRPDVIFHLAAASGQKVSDSAEVVRTIVTGTHAVCSALRRAGRTSRLVLAGSSAQYGAAPVPGEPITEAVPCRPLSPYGYAKAAAEALAFGLSLDGAFELVAVRPFNHVGPGEPPTTVAGALATRIVSVIEGRAERVQVASLAAVRDFTDVRDVARGYMALAERGVPGRVYNICSGRGRSVREILDGLLKAAHLDDSIVEVLPDREDGVAHQVGSPVQIRADTGWTAEITLDTSLTDLFREARGERLAPDGDSLEAGRSESAT